MVLRRIGRNKHLAFLVLILVGLPLIFHDYLIAPWPRMVKHIPPWAIEYHDVEFSRDDLGLLLGQVTWLVKSLQRKAVMDENVKGEIRNFENAMTAMVASRDLFQERIANLERTNNDYKLHDSMQKRHREMVDSVRSNLNKVEIYLAELESHAKAYNSIWGDNFWLTKLRRNYSRNRIFEKGERLLAVIYREDAFLADRPWSPERLPTQVPNFTGSKSPELSLNNHGKKTLASSLSDIMFVSTAFAAEPPLADDLSETLETRRGATINDLAEQLGKDPVRIYEYVRNHIDYVPTVGSVQGAEGTLRSEYGNAVDQASLLIALLRASDIPARYVRGKVEIPVEKVKQWIGSKDANTAVSIFNRNGVLANVGVSRGGYATIEIEHTWVRAYVLYEPYRGAGRSNDSGSDAYWIDLDPSFKQYESGPYLDVATEIGVDPWSFLVSIKGEATVNEEESWAKNIPEDLIIDKLDDWADRVERYAKANNRVPENIYQARKIISERLKSLPSTLPYKVIDEPAESATLAPNHGFAVNIKLMNPDNSVSLSHDTDILTLDHKRVTLSYIPATPEARDILDQYANEPNIPAYLVDLIPQLMIDGEVVATGSGAAHMATDQYMSVTISGPGLVSREAVRPVPAGSYLALVFDPQGISTGNLYDELSGLRRVKDDLESGSPTASLDDVIGRTLHVMGMAYFQELDRMTRIAAASLQVHATRQPSFLTIGYEVVGDKVFDVPLTAQAKRLAISIDRNSLVPVSLTGDKTDEKQFMVIAGLTAAALEHNVLVQTTGGEAASALRIVQAASTGDIPVYTITPDNYEQILTTLPDLPADIRAKVGDAAHAQMVVTVPDREIDYAGYSGIGYIVYDPNTGASGYYIEGALAGGVRYAPFLSASDLISRGDPGGYLSLLNPTLGWINLAGDVTTSVAWRYAPAVSAINNWFRSGDQLDKVAFIAAGIAISGPIGVLTDRAEIAQFTVIPELFSPNADGRLDTVSISAGISRESSWDVTVVDEADEQVKIFTGTGQSISLTWDGTDNSGSPVPDGLYTINADAVALGKTIPARTQSAQVELDATAPDIAIITPAANQQMNGMVSVAGNVDDPNLTSWTLDTSCSGGAWENLTSGDSPVLSGTLGIFDSALYAAGDCVLRLSASDSVGNDAVLGVNVINEAQGQEAPVVSIVSPAAGEVSGIVPVVAHATDDLGVEKVEIYIDGSREATLSDHTDNQYSYDLNTSLYANGPLEIKARAYDERGVYSEASVAVTLNNGIFNIAANPQLFTPDGDGKDETVTISAGFTAPSDWTLDIKKATDGSLIKGFTGAGDDSISVVWDGKDTSGLIPQNAAFDCIAEVTLTGSGATASAGFRLETVNRPPEIVIHSPGDMESITSQTDIVVTVKDSDLVSWKLEYTEVKDGLNPTYFDTDFTELASGDESVINKPIFEFDPTQMKNNPYFLRLSAVDTENPEKAIMQEIIVTGNLKIGLFTISFEDLTVPLGGLPIVVGRTYSSIERHTKGEFSYGWKMFIRDVDVKEDSNRNVTVTMPGGRRVTFYNEIKQQNPVTLRMTWTAEPGVYDKLEMIGDNRLLYDANAEEILGFFHDYMAYLEPTPYEESIIPGYVLTDRGGTKFTIKRPVISTDPLTDKPTYGDLELVSVVDTNGNRLLYDTAGIHWGCDDNGSNCIEEVTFTRDAGNDDRITSVTDPAGNEITYEYDGAGDLIKVTYQDDTSTEFKYVADHYLQDIIAPNGVRATRNEYDEQGHLVAVIDPDGNRVEFTHKPGTKQDVIKDRLGNITVYEYDDRGNVVSETDALGHRVESNYDANDNEIRLVDESGNTMTRVFDNRGYMTSDSDALGETTSYTYDGNGNLLTIRDALGHYTSNEYDKSGNLLKSTDALGYSTSYTYNSRGKRISETNALGYSQTYKYDKKGRRIETTDPSGNTSYTYHNNMGNLTSWKSKRGFTTVYTYDNVGRLLTTTDPLGNKTTYEYNSAGKETTTTDHTGAVTEIVYDEQGRIVQSINPDGTSTQAIYDIEGRVVKSIDKTGNVSEVIHDALGNVVKYIGPNGATFEVTYDTSGNLIRVKSPKGGIINKEYNAIGRAVKLVDALGNETNYEYGSTENKTAVIDANSNRWISEYDALSNRIATLYPDGTKSLVEYDAIGNRCAIIDQAGIKTEFVYDENRNLTGVNDAEGGNTSFTYDADDNMLTINDPNGHVTEFTYDALGRKTSRTLPEGMTESWLYNDCCRSVTQTDFNGAVITYEYDSMKRIRKTIYPDGSWIERQFNPYGQISNVAYSPSYGFRNRVLTYDKITGRLAKDEKEDGQFIEYKYDIAGNLIEAAYSGGHTVHYVYDLLDRLETVTDDNGSTEYTYNAVGGRDSMAYPNGTIANYEFDNLNRLTSLKNEGPDGIISSYKYTLGPTGNHVKIEEHNGDVNEYQYDKLYRLTRESRTGDHAYWIEYKYDAFGNRFDRSKNGAVTTYTYDMNDRLLTETGPAGTTDYSWDNNGNMTGKTTPEEAWVYQWNYDNKLILAENNGILASAYKYDYFGERVQKTTAEGVVNYLIDNNNLTGYSQVLRETDAVNTEFVSYTFGNDLINQARKGAIPEADISFLHYDGLGSTRSMTSSSSSIVTDQFNYMAFGSTLSKSGNTDIGYLFTGESYDKSLGNYYLRSRNYNPESGIFLSQDIFGGVTSNPLSLNKYIYTNNDPINSIDPSGQSPLVGLMIALAIMTILVTTGCGKSMTDLDYQKLAVSIIKNSTVRSKDANQYISIDLLNKIKAAEAKRIALSTRRKIGDWIGIGSLGPYQTKKDAYLDVNRDYKSVIVEYQKEIKARSLPRFGKVKSSRWRHIYAGSFMALMIGNRKKEGREFPDQIKYGIATYNAGIKKIIYYQNLISNKKPETIITWKDFEKPMRNRGFTFIPNYVDDVFMDPEAKDGQ